MILIIGIKVIKIKDVIEIGKKKRTIDDIRFEASKLGLEVVDNEYINWDKKITFKNAEGYLSYSSIISINQNKIPSIFGNGNPYTIQNIKLWCKLNNKNFKLISEEFINAKEYLLWQCLNEHCEEVFKMSWDHIKAGECCHYCSGHKVGLSNCLANKNPTLSKEWHPSQNELTPFDVTYKSHEEVWWKCIVNPKHEWKSLVSNRDTSDCPYCSHNLPSEDYNLLVCSPELASEWDYDKNEKRPEDFCPSASQYVWWTCNECGNGWKSTINNRTKRGCPVCNQSKGEKECKRVFDLRNIYYIPQKTFDSLVGLGGGNLSYDFYLPQYNILVEYQGEFHDGTAGNQSKQDFKKQQEHDKRKRIYAQNNSIKLVEIWYWDFNNIEEILDIKVIGQTVILI